MAIDILSEIEIRCPRTAAAAFAGNPDNAPEWRHEITAVEWKTPRPTGSGSQFVLLSPLLGRAVSRRVEIVRYEPGECLIMRNCEAMLPTQTVYRWETTVNGSTRMTVRMRGAAHGYLRIIEPLIAWSVRRRVHRDLRNLKLVLEDCIS